MPNGITKIETRLDLPDNILSLWIFREYPQREIKAPFYNYPRIKRQQYWDGIKQADAVSNENSRPRKLRSWSTMFSTGARCPLREQENRTQKGALQRATWSGSPASPLTALTRLSRVQACVFLLH